MWCCITGWGAPASYNVPSKHWKLLTQWHGITSHTTGMLKTCNLQVQTVCSLLVLLNVNIYILCAMVYDKLPKRSLCPTGILPSCIHLHTYLVLDIDILCFQRRSLITLHYNLLVLQSYIHTAHFTTKSDILVSQDLSFLKHTNTNNDLLGLPQQ